MSNQAYINSIAPIAQASVKGTGLFASVMIAQACEESGYGNSKLASQYNNHFGIKAQGNWSGSTVKMDTTEIIDSRPIRIKADFRTYGSIESGFDDRVKLLQKNPRYKAVFSAATPEAQAQALQSAGYATDPHYAQKLIEVMHENNLQRFDTGTAPAVPQKKAVPAAKPWPKWALPVVVILVALIVFAAMEELL